MRIATPFAAVRFLAAMFLLTFFLIFVSDGKLLESGRIGHDSEFSVGAPASGTAGGDL